MTALHGFLDGLILGALALWSVGCSTAPMEPPPLCDTASGVAPCPAPHPRAVNPSLTRAWLDQGALISNTCVSPRGRVFYCKKGVRR
jgi:hypothetical protein